MKRECPDDLVVLESRTLGGLDLDVCPRCAGIFFDEGEIAALQQSGPSMVVEVEEACEPGGLTFVESPVPKRCPGCKKPMRAYAYRYSSDIRLDGCDACGGIWVQDGELAKIADHLAAPPKTFGGIPAARREAEAHNATARRHLGLVRYVVRLIER